MDRRNYYVGVLLTASRNYQNRIQFVARKERNGKVSLFSRTGYFKSKPDFTRMKRHGVFNSVNEAVDSVQEGLDEAMLRGITEPSVSLITVG